MPKIDIEEKYGFSAKTVKRYTGEEAQFMGRIVDDYLQKKAKELGAKIPEKGFRRETKYPSYKGAYVKTPKKGIHDGICVLDFVSLYPSIIVSYNISAETINIAGEKLKNGKRAYGKEKGFIPKVLEDLISKKAAASGQTKEFFKRLTASMYGVIGQPFSRWYSYECATKITELGRWHITDLIKSAEKIGKVIYGDTDSVFVQADEAKARRFCEEYNKTLPGIMRLEFKGFYDKGFFVSQKGGKKRSASGSAAKKKYALLAGNKLTIKGFEAVRSDWCLAAREMQKDILKLVMMGNKESALKRAKEAIESMKRKRTKKKDVVLTTVISRPLEKYKAKAPHITVAKAMEKKGKKIEYGYKVSYIITEGEKSPRGDKSSGKISDRAKPASEVKGNGYDADYYIKNQLVPAALRVLEEFGYSEKDLLG